MSDQAEVKMKHPGEYLKLTKYSKKLEGVPEFKRWILPNENDPYSAKCKYCTGTTLKPERNVLLKHAQTKKHLRNSNLNVKCRTCLINSTQDNMRSMFSIDETTNLPYTDIIFCITGVQIVLEKDDLPSGMCSECRMFAVKAYNFQMQVKRADALLHKGVKTDKNYDEDDDDMADASFLDYEQLEWEPESYSDDFKTEITEKCKSEPKSNQCCLCSDSFDSSVELLKHVQSAHPKVIKGPSNETERSTRSKTNKKILQVPVRELPSAKRTAHPRDVKGSSEGTKRSKMNTTLLQVPVKLSELPSAKRTAQPKDIKGSSEGTRRSKTNRTMLQVPVTQTMLTSATGSRANGLRPCSIPILGVLDLTKDDKSVARYSHRCSICSALFKDEAQLDEHSRDHASSEVIMCSLCEQVYFKYCHFKRHFVSQHPDLEAVIQIDNTENLLELKDASAVDTVLQFIRMTTIGDLIQANIEPSAQPVEIEAFVQVCGLCGFVILSPEDLQAHNQTQHPDIDTRCFYCAKTFTDKVGLTHHRKICRVLEKGHECVSCGAKFHVESALVKHMSRKHPDIFSRWVEHRRNSPRHVCQKCNNTFALEKQLKKHKTLCNPESLFICDFCSKEFTIKMYLQRHIKYVHDADRKRHLCNVCGKGFPIHHQFVVHMRTHTRDFPYKCTLCPKSFATGHGFKYHQRWHTGDTPHICAQCGKRFIRKVSLRNHILIHTGERPYPCDLCTVAFRQQYDLVKHRARVHGAYHKGNPRTENELVGADSSAAVREVKSKVGLKTPSAVSRASESTKEEYIEDEEIEDEEKYQTPAAQIRSLPIL